MTRDNATSRARAAAGCMNDMSALTGTSNQWKDNRMTAQDSPDTATPKEPSGAARLFGDFAPALVHFTDDVLFGEAWTRPELSPRDRSLVTVTALAAAGNTGQLTFHLGLARQNGLTGTELIEAITHLAFYAGWPRAMSAMTVARQVPGEEHDDE